MPRCLIHFVAETVAVMRNALTGCRLTSPNVPVKRHGGSHFCAALLWLGLAAMPAGATGFAQNFGGQVSTNTSINASIVDAAGNQYLAGNFNGATLTLGGVTLTRIGPQDAFVAKRDSSGNVLWAKNFGGAGASVQGQALAADGAGNVVLGGSFFNANLTTPALIKIGARDAFAFKLDGATGGITWAKNFGGNAGANAYATGLAAAGAGNVVLGGYFQGANLTTPALTKIGAGDAFAFKLDGATGAITWAKSFGGPGADTRGQALTAAAGNVVLGGFFFNASLTTPTLTQIGTADAFAFKLDGATGAITWAKSFGGAGAYTQGLALAADGAGNVALGGYFVDANLTTPALTRIGVTDAFALKLNGADGSLIWANNFGGAGAYAAGLALAADGAGNVVLGGYFLGTNLTTPALTQIGSQDAFAFKINGATGSVVWVKNFGGANARAFSQALAADGAGNVVLAGIFRNGNLTTPALAQSGNQDAFVFKLDVDTGASLGADGYGGGLIPGGNAQIVAVVLDASANAYFAGSFDGATLTLGGVTLTRMGSRDAFVAKRDSSGNVLWAKNFGGVRALAYGLALAADGAGNVVLGGYFQGANLTTPALTQIGAADAFAFKVDGATGGITWAKNFGGSAGAFAYATGLAVDGAGNVALGGFFSNANLTTPALTVIGGSDAFAFKLDGATGGTIWAKNFGGAGASTQSSALAFGGSGSVVLGGYFYGANLSTPALTKIGAADAFAFKLDGATGAITWAKNFGGAGASAGGQALAADSAGNVVLGGYFQGANLAAPALTKIGNTDAFAVKLSGATGSITWAENFGGAGAYAYSAGLAVDGAGNMVLGGYFQNANLTTPALTQIGVTDAFAFKLDGATGGIARARNFGGAGANAQGQALAADAAGNAVLGGFFNGANLTMPALTKIGSQDAFVLTPTHGVSYNGNGSTSGSVPTDIKGYWSGDTATVLGNTGALLKTGYKFAGWNTAADGSGTSYLAGNTLVVGASITADITLYAKWTVQILDIDGNNRYDAATDGVILLRYLFGFTGNALTAGALSVDAMRTDPAQILQYLNQIKPLLDVDGNQKSDALTDGLLIIRHLLGLSGNALVQGAIGTGATRISATDVTNYIQSLTQ